MFARFFLRFFSRYATLIIFNVGDFTSVPPSDENQYLTDADTIVDTLHANFGNKNTDGTYTVSIDQNGAGVELHLVLDDEKGTLAPTEAVTVQKPSTPQTGDNTQDRGRFCVLSRKICNSKAHNAITCGGINSRRFLLQFSLSCDKINKKEAVVMIEQMVSNCLLRKDYVHDNCKQ